MTVSESGTVNPTSLTVLSGQSVTSAQFSLVRNQGSGNTDTMTAKVSGVTELTITLSS